MAIPSAPIVNRMSDVVRSAVASSGCPLNTSSALGGHAVPQLVKSLPAGSVGQNNTISAHVTAVLSAHTRMNPRSSDDSILPRGKTQVRVAHAHDVRGPYDHPDRRTSGSPDAFSDVAAYMKPTPATTGPRGLRGRRHQVYAPTATNVGDEQAPPDREAVRRRRGSGCSRPPTPSRPLPRCLPRRPPKPRARAPCADSNLGNPEVPWSACRPESKLKGQRGRSCAASWRSASTAFAQLATSSSCSVSRIVAKPVYSASISPG